MTLSTDASWRPGRRDLRIVLLLMLLAALCRLPRLGTPPKEVFDEVYHARTALEYVEGRPPTDWVHPPLAKLLIAVGIRAFGYHPWAFRLAPAIAGILLAPMFYLLARRLLTTERAALLASVVLLTDGVYLVQSRTAMTNVFAVLFQVAAAFFVLDAIRRPILPLGRTLAAGFFLGLAISTRWTSLWAGAFLAAVILAVRGRRLLRPRDLALTVLAGLVLPAVLYLSSYVPWIIQGHGLGDVLRMQHDIWRYHSDLRAVHPYFSAWYTWPWLYHPTWYFYAKSGASARAIIALGNPALWWATLPVTAWALVTGVRQRDGRLLFSGLGFCALYLPWAVSPRQLNFSHYLFEALPYACLSLGALLDRAWEGRQASLARGFVLLAVLLFVATYPVLTAMPLPAALLDGTLRHAILSTLGH